METPKTVVTEFNSGYYTVVLGANTRLVRSMTAFWQNPTSTSKCKSMPNPRCLLDKPCILLLFANGWIVESIEGTVNASEVESMAVWSLTAVVLEGPTMGVTWSSIQNIPADIADGDDDTGGNQLCSG